MMYDLNLYMYNNFIILKWLSGIILGSKENKVYALDGTGVSELFQIIIIKIMVHQIIVIMILIKITTN
jgi:hypothetical protein